MTTEEFMNLQPGDIITNLTGDYELIVMSKYNAEDDSILFMYLPTKRQSKYYSSGIISNMKLLKKATPLIRALYE